MEMGYGVVHPVLENNEKGKPREQEREGHFDSRAWKWAQGALEKRMTLSYSKKERLAKEAGSGYSISVTGSCSRPLKKGSCL